MGRFALLAAPAASAAYLRPGPLGEAFAAGVRAAARPAVDVVAAARPAARPRDDEGYEYARGMWAGAPAAEQIDPSSMSRYEAMAEGRFAGSTMPGCELPGQLFDGRRTCGRIAVLGHVGDRAS